MQAGVAVSRCCIDPRPRGLVIPKARSGNVSLGAAVGKDVEEVQTLPMNPARGRWQEGFGSAVSDGVPVAVAPHLGTHRLFQEPVALWSRS